MKRIIVLSLAVLVACLVLPSDVAAGSERTIERRFDVEMGGKLELEIDTGAEINISGWDKESAEVSVIISGRDRDEVEVDFDESSSRLKIRSRYRRSRMSHKSDVDLEIKVPERFDVEIDSNGGSITIRDLEGSISGETMGGELDLSRVGGKVHLRTMGGDVEVTDSRLDGRIETMGGDILIKDVKGDIRGSTMGGEVTYENVTGRSIDSGDEEVRVSSMGGNLGVDYSGKKVRARTLGGNIDISESEEVHAVTFGGDIDISKSEKVEVSTMGGDIDIGEALAGADVKTMGGDIKIRYAGEYVKARTMGGDIEVEGVDGWIKATTMGGDVDVTMVGNPDEGRRDVELKSMGGDITLKVPEGLSMEFDIELAYTKKSRRDYKIVSDFDMHIERTEDWEYKWGGRRKYIYGTGTVGDGEHKIKIRTTNGNIYVIKGK